MTTTAKILVVDDERNIRFFLHRVLTRDGHDVVAVEHGAEALQAAQEHEFDLALLDLKLKDMSGLDVLTALRRNSPHTAVIVLTGYASVDTAVEALRHGAHDYLFKPAKTMQLRESVRTGLLKRQRELRRQELLDRLQANLASSLEDIRSATILPQVAEIMTEEEETESESEAGRFLQRGHWLVDFMRHVITLEGQLLELTPTEFDLLAYMIGEAPRVIPPQELVQEVQGYEVSQWEAGDTVRYHIYNLRSKLEAVGVSKEIIQNVRGVGYTIAEETLGQ